MKAELIAKSRTENNLSLPKLIIDSILDKKGSEIVKLDLTESNERVCDFFIICEAGSPTQVKAIANHIEDNVEEILGQQPFSTEGRKGAEWMIVDYIDVVVHIFVKRKRLYYQLEDMWSDAAVEKIEA